MYDALNKAYARSTGDIIGHLNCDEQYLPGTLEYVQEQFNRDPDLQVLTGAVVVTYPDGSYSCSRLPAPPGRWHTQVCHLSLFTAATFYRRSLIEDLGMFFDTRYRAAGDADLFIRIIQSSVKIKLCHQYFALFTETGENLALSNTALEEQNYLKQKAPRIIVKFSNLIAGTHKFKKLLYKCYFPQKFTYSFLNKDLIREKVYVGNPRGVWKDRRNKNL
jgi:hypothetical protein